MDAIVAGSNGLLKKVDLRTESFANVNSVAEAQPKADAATRICWVTPTNEDEEVLLCAQLDRRLCLVDVATGLGREVLKMDGDAAATPGSPINGLELINSARVATCDESGAVRVWRSANNNKDDAAICSTSELDAEPCLALQAGTNVRCMRSSPAKRQLLATGGHGDRNKLAVWDVDALPAAADNDKKAKPIFIMKNVGEDHIRLQVPILVNDLHFVPESADQLVTCTGNHLVRYYDTRAQRKPVAELGWGEDPFTALATRPDMPHQCFVGTNKGHLALMDRRARGTAVHVYKGYTGAIRDLQCHPSEPLLIGCGVDRFVCVHDVNTRRLKHKIYCKSQLNRVLFSRNMPCLAKDNPTVKAESTDDVRNRESDSDEETWDALPVVGKPQRMRFADEEKKRRFSDEPETEPISAKRNKPNPTRKRLLRSQTENSTNCADTAAKTAAEPEVKSVKAKKSKLSGSTLRKRQPEVEDASIVSDISKKKPKPVKV